MKVELRNKYIFIDDNGNEILVRATGIDSKTGLHSFQPIISTVQDLAPHLKKLITIQTITISKDNILNKIKPC